MNARTCLTTAIALVVTGTFAGMAAPAAAVEVQPFTAGTPARAADVNQNFSNVKSAIELGERRIAALQERIDDLEVALTNVLALNEVLRVEAINGVRTVRLSGVNLQLINGLGLTESTNGAGNIIIGYDETNRLTDRLYCSLGRSDDGLPTEDEASCLAAGGVFAAIHKSGSHNLVVGSQNNYSASGGIVAGKNNTVNERFASVLGGVRNRSTGFLSTVLGGQDNLAFGNSSTVSGGQDNESSGGHASIGGGRGNLANGEASTIAGGESGVASGNGATVSGGSGNTASGIYSSVSGGIDNVAAAIQSSILGGRSQELSGNLGHTGTIPVLP